MTHTHHAHRPPRLPAALPFLAAAFFIIHSTFFISASASIGASGADTGTRAPQRGLILVPDEAHAMTMNLAVQRLRSHSPIRLDLVDGAPDNRTDFNNYDLTIILGVTDAPGATKELAQAWINENDRPKSDDAWALKTISTTPLVIVATGNRPRAVLYAVWRLADKLALGDDITTLAMQEVPRIDRRYAAICGTAYGGSGKIVPHPNRHTLFMETLDEMPLYGINGVYLCPGTWRVAPGPGPQPPPVSISPNGKVSANETTLPDWRAMIETIKAYDLDVVMTIESFVPPAFNIKKLEKDYITGGKRPPGYLDAMESLNRDYIEKLLDLLPGIDGLVLHAGVEGARYSGPNINGVRLFLSKQNLDASAEAMSRYLKLAVELAKKHNKYLSFWTHQYGINTAGIAAMRRMLFNFPDITIIEEDYWPNSLWINGDRLPIMAYLDKPLRDEIDKHGNKLGFFETTDAETCGAGALPTAIGETFAYSMREILKRNTGMVAFRLNLHDRTPFGTLWSVSGIQLEQSCNQLWQNPAPESEVQQRWIRRLYGNAAAPLITEALSNDRKIITAITDINGLHRVSKIGAPGWLPQNGRLKRFAPPPDASAAHHKPKPARASGATLESGEQEDAQMGYDKLRFPAYDRQNKAAAELTRRSLDLIEQARPMLARADYAYLHEIYDTARIILEAVRRLGEASYAANLMKDNYDNIPDVKTYFERTIKSLDDYAASKDVRWISTERESIHGNLAQELRTVSAAYRKYAEGN